MLLVDQRGFEPLSCSFVNFLHTTISFNDRLPRACGSSVWTYESCTHTRSTIFTPTGSRFNIYLTLDLVTINIFTMNEELNQLESFVRNCCKFRPEGGKFIFLGVNPEQLQSLDDLNSHWDVEYHDSDFADELSDAFPRLHFDLVYLHDVGKQRSIIDMAYQWGPKVKGGGALAGWGYRDKVVNNRLLQVIGDCPSKWPDIWALPIVEA